MFVQVIRGKVASADALRAADDEWKKSMKPGAKGYLGSTKGVADDGTAMIVARFDSEASAKANSERPEQGEWWNTHGSKAFQGDPTFFDSTDVETFRKGGSDDAGFVQVMVGKVDDVEGYKKIGKSLESAVAEMRPDVIGGITAFAPDGRFYDITYFTSEAEAREGEKKELPAELQDAMSEFGNPIQEFIDLRDPWFDSA
jgi:hypothetical protein